MNDDVAARLVVETVRSGRTVRFIARGTSMRPTVNDGDLVEVAPCDGTLRLGGVYALERPDGGLALHRALGVADWVVSWADGPMRPDRWRPHRVVGRVRVVEPAAPENGSRRASRRLFRLAETTFSSATTRT